jgi:hypothetical protein
MARASSYFISPQLSSYLPLPRMQISPSRSLHFSRRRSIDRWMMNHSSLASSSSLSSSSSCPSSATWSFSLLLAARCVANIYNAYLQSLKRGIIKIHTLLANPSLGTVRVGILMLLHWKSINGYYR